MWVVATILDSADGIVMSLQKVLLDSDILVIQDTDWKCQIMERSARELVLKAMYSYYLQVINAAGIRSDHI